jgi:DNA modification methylase
VLDEEGGGVIRILEGDCTKVMRELAENSVHCCVTSPPYWGGLRDYGHAAQLGLERDPAAYVTALVEVFRDVRRVLRGDGCLWLNVGDVYAASGKGGGGSAGERDCWSTVRERKGFRMPPAGYKMKDLTLVAFQVADALRRDGWYLRSTVIWRKHAATEPMRLDRPAVSHEYLFLLAPSEQYQCRGVGEPWWGHSVWDPSELARRCIVTGCPEGGTVLDPFGGAGTTGLVADQLQRNAVLVELNPDYIAIARRRIAADAPLFAEVHS